MVDIVKDIAWIISLFLTIYAGYFTIVALISLFPDKKQTEQFEPQNKFAVVIAARNEARVIANLVDSLFKQKYPRELFDVIVIPNNCTDNTKQVAEQSGADIFECTGVITCKGDVLHEYFDSIMKSDDRVYDAFCIFDADNVVDENFISEMNNALCRGAKVAQGYRDSKNSTDTYISSCHSIFYWIVNRFYNRARSNMGLSLLINGSGFMISDEMIRKLGGWNTTSITEDGECTMQCILAGEKVRWVPKAITYDEQPLTFTQSWNQRKRWSTGQIQLFEKYFVRLLKNAFKNKSLSSIDMAICLFAPYMTSVYLLSILITLVLNLFYIEYFYFPRTDIYYKMFLSLDYSYLMNTAVALWVVFLERKKPMIQLKGIATFWVFTMSWIPINILCLFKKQTKWEQLDHTRTIKIEDFK